MSNKLLMAKALGITAVFGILAYGFASFGFMPYHDSLWCAFQISQTHNEFVSQIAFGRVLQPAYITIVGAIATTPTTSIALPICWIGLSVFLLCKLLSTTCTIEISLVSLSLVANKTMISLVATYLPWLGPDTFSLLLTVSAAYLWRTYYEDGRVWKLLIAAVCVGASLGLYQSFVCSYIVTVLLVSVKDLFDGDKAVIVIKRGFCSVFILGIGCCIYLLLLIAIPKATNIGLAEGGYNSITNIGSNDESWQNRIFLTLKEVAVAFFSPKHIASIWEPKLIVILNVIIICAFTPLFFLAAKQKQLSVKAVLLSVALVLSAIFFANITRCLNQTTHDLMHYAFWLLYLFPILILSAARRGAHKYNKGDGLAINHRISMGISSVLVLCLALIAFNNIQTSNTVLMDRSIRYNASQSLVTEMLTRVDALPGYVEGKTAVAFIGKVDGSLSTPTLAEKTQALLAQRNSGESFSGYTYLKIMINDLMLRKTVIMPESEVASIKKNPDIASMPTWPSDGSVAMIDGTAVVKFS